MSPYDLIRRIVHLWQTPSAFRDEPGKYARNVAGHSLAVGFLPGLILGPAGVGLGLGLYAMWELSQWQWRRATPADCWEDWAFVAAGAFLGLTGSLGYLILILAFLGAGIFLRAEGRAD